MGQLVRVLPGLYATRPDIERLARENELYFAFYALNYALRDGLVQIVSNQPVPAKAKSFPVMRHRGLDDNWFIGDGSKEFSLREIPKMLKVKQLTPEQRKLSISSYLLPHPAMVKELARGWTPERDDEFRRKDTVETEVRDAANARSAEHREPVFIDHYLYFPQRSNAERAAQRLRAKDWLVEVKQAAVGEDWLALAKQPAPIKDDIGEVRDELERLARELGGEYDGWGAAVKDEPNVQ
jgi:hypothetical protein